MHALACAAHRFRALRSLRQGIHGELLAPQNADSSGISSSAAVGVACLLALEAANGLSISFMDNVELDRCTLHESLNICTMDVGIVAHPAICTQRRDQ